MNHFNLDPSATAIHLPAGNERNEYSLMLWGPNATLTADPADTTGAWEFLDLDPVPPTGRGGITTTGFTPKAGYVPLACLTGAFRETGAGGVHRFKLLHGTTTISCTLLVQSLQNITINVSDLPPIVRERPYKVQITADGGRKPYVWKLNDNSDLPTTLTFNKNGDGVLEGSVNEDRNSGRTLLLSVTATSNDGPEQQQAERAFNIQVVEPGQIGAHITGWVDVAVGLMGLYGFAHFIYEVVHNWRQKPAEQRVDLAKELDAFLGDRGWKAPLVGWQIFDEMSGENFADHIRDLLVQRPELADFKAHLKAVVQALEKAEATFKDHTADRQKALADSTDPKKSEDERATARADIEKIDREVADKKRITDAIAKLKEHKANLLRQQLADKHLYKA